MGCRRPEIVDASIRWLAESLDLLLRGTPSTSLAIWLVVLLTFHTNDRVKYRMQSWNTGLSILGRVIMHKYSSLNARL